MSVCVCLSSFRQLYLSGISCFQEQLPRSKPSDDPPKRPTAAKNIDGKLAVNEEQARAHARAYGSFTFANGGSYLVAVIWAKS